MRRLDEFLACCRVGHQLEMAPGLNAVKPREVQHPGSQAVLVLGHELQPRGLVLPADEPRDIDAPRLNIRRVEPELGNRNAQFSAPALVVDAHRRAPHRVPRLAFEGVVRNDRIPLHAGGSDAERHACPMIVAGIEGNHRLIRVLAVVSVRQPPRDLLRLAVVHPHAEVHRLIVEQHADLGPLCRRLAFVRIALRKPACDVGVRPGFLGQPAVYHGRFGGARRVHNGPRTRGRRRGLLRVNRRSRRECQRKGAEGASHG